MEQFNLEKYLENPSRKVVTRDRRKVRIICTDCKSSALPIIAEIQNPKTNTWFIDFFNIDGTTEIDKQKQRDLFFADEEEELTEFEKKLKEVLYEHATTNTSSEEKARQYAPELLDLARKELEPEFDKKLKEAYNQGGLDTQEEITKCLPKWKKDCFHNIISVVDGRLFYNGYYIDINELEKLPKEE